MPAPTIPGNLLRITKANDRCRDRGMVQRPGGRCLSRTAVITSGNCSQVFHHPQIASSAGSLNPGRFRRQSSARKFATRSRVIAPVSRPAYIGEYTITRLFWLRQNGEIFCSISHRTSA